jgi:hypothetical protein
LLVYSFPPFEDSNFCENLLTKYVVLLLPLGISSFDEWPDLIRAYSKSKTYEQLKSFFDEVERKLVAHTGPLPSKPKAADRSSRKRVMVQETAPEMEEDSLSCFNEE